MEPEDLEPRTKRIAPRDLDIMSVGDLEDYIAEMEVEIARARQVIARKTDHRSAADKLFKL